MMLITKAFPRQRWSQRATHDRTTFRRIRRTYFPRRRRTRRAPTAYAGAPKYTRVRLGHLAPRREVSGENFHFGPFVRPSCPIRYLDESFGGSARGKADAVWFQLTETESSVDGKIVNLLTVNYRKLTTENELNEQCECCFCAF